MLGVIAQHSVEIITFISWLSPALYQPQIRHLIRLVDALLVCDSRKTLTNLYRQLADCPDPKTAAGFFRESPWQVVDVSGPRNRWMLLKFLEVAHKLKLAPIPEAQHLLGLSCGQGRSAMLSRASGLAQSFVAP